MRLISLTTRSSAASQLTGTKPTPSTALQRSFQSIGMLVLHVALDAFGAELPSIERKVFPRFETDDLVVLHAKLNAALLSAEAAMGFDNTVRLNFCIPSMGGNSIQRRARTGTTSSGIVTGGLAIYLSADFEAASRVPCSRHFSSWAMASDLRLQTGHTS